MDGGDLLWLVRDSYWPSLTPVRHFLPQKACLTVEENLRLKSRLQVAEAEAEAGPRQASSAEQDYEEVIQLLEAEIKDLKSQLAGKRQARGLEATKVSHR